MFKKLKIKKLISLLLVFLLFVNSFMSYATSNDGSNFITKAEFDSLKNTFQSQLDEYNKGIDTKIDEAIIAYLAGIVVSTTINGQLLCANSTDLIESAVGDDTIPWIKGDAKIEFKATEFNTKPKTFHTFSCLTGTRTGDVPFKERIIDNVDYTNGTGRWYGYCETKQTFSLYGIHEEWNKDGTNDNISATVSYHEGWWPYTNTNFNKGESGVIIGFEMRPIVTSACSAIWEANKATSGISRLYQADATSKYLNCFDSNYAATRFSNYEIKDFCNDDTVIGHGVEKIHIPDIFDAAKNVLYFAGRSQDGDGNHKWYSGSSSTYTIKTWNGNFAAQTAKGTTSFYLPYIGFVPACKSWGKIWTDQYDSFANKVVANNPSVSHISITKGSTATNHLNLDAGTPMFLISGEGDYSVDIEFDDAADHGVWFKKDGWASGARPCDQIDNLKCNNASDFTILNGDGYEVPNSTKKTFKFKFTKADIGKYVFMNWSLISGAVADWHGGGTLKLPKTYTATIVK